jgi:peptidoglycan/LPS O-acetylase OafA/YrhL
VPLTYAASVVASILLYEGVEKPVQRLLRKRVG